MSKHRRLKLTLILLCLLFAGYAVKADNACHVALEIQDSTIRRLETRLATAQSLPYNQGYQEGYKVAKLEEDNAGTLIGIVTICLVILSVPALMIIQAIKD
jgi:hypothetical protein